jgi:hypothetical protein
MLKSLSLLVDEQIVMEECVRYVFERKNKQFGNFTAPCRPFFEISQRTTARARPKKSDAPNFWANRCRASFLGLSPRPSSRIFSLTVSHLSTQCSSMFPSAPSNHYASGFEVILGFSFVIRPLSLNKTSNSWSFLFLLSLNSTVILDAHTHSYCYVYVFMWI